MNNLKGTEECREIISRHITELSEDTQIHLLWWIEFNELRCRNAGKFTRLLYRGALNRVVDHFEVANPDMIAQLRLMYNEKTTDMDELQSRGYDLTEYGVHEYTGMKLLTA